MNLVDRNGFLDDDDSKGSDSNSGKYVEGSTSSAGSDNRRVDWGCYIIRIRLLKSQSLEAYPT